MNRKVRLTNEGLGLHVGLSKEVKNYSTPFKGSMSSMTRCGINIIRTNIDEDRVKFNISRQFNVGKYPNKVLENDISQIPLTTDELIELRDSIDLILKEHTKRKTVRIVIEC